MTGDEHGVIAYQDGLVIDPASGEIVEAPALGGDRLAYVTHKRHGGKAQTKLWDRALGGWDAYLKRQLEDANKTMVTVEIGGARLALSTRYQRRTKYRVIALVQMLQEEIGSAYGKEDQAGALGDLVADLVELVSMATGFRAEDVRRIAPDRRLARWLALAAAPYTTEPWIETAPVLESAPIVASEE